MTLEQLKLPDGKYPARVTRPGTGDLVVNECVVAYVTIDYGLLCAACANGENGSRAAELDLDPSCREDQQWIVTNYLLLWELDKIEPCSHCGAKF